MITIGLTKAYAALASDSARNDAESGIVFGSPKITLINNRYILSFLGTPLYFSNLKPQRFTENFNQTVLYLQEYFKEMEPKVKSVMKASGEKKAKPFLMALIGIHNSLPTAVVFSEKLNFEPRYTWTKTETPKFLLPGGGDKKEKWPEIQGDFELVPGLMGEVLTKKIYEVSDRQKEKTSGGVVTVAFINEKGPFGLNNWEIINGYRESAISEYGT